MIISGIVQQPSSQTTCIGGAVAFAVIGQTDSTNLPIGYCWRKNGAAISPLINYSAVTPTLQILGVRR